MATKLQSALAGLTLVTAGAAAGRATAPENTVETERVEYAPARVIDDVATTMCVEGVKRAQQESVASAVDLEAAKAACLKAKPSLTNAAEAAARKIAAVGADPDPRMLRAVANEELEALAQINAQSQKRDAEERYVEELEKCKRTPGCVAPRPGGGR